MPRPVSRTLELRGAGALHRDAGGAGARRGQGLGRRGPAPHLQRLLRRRRRDGGARLRQLRHPARTTRCWTRSGSACRGRSSSRATARAGAGSSRRWRRSTARWAASSTRTREDDGYWVDDVYPKGPMRPGAGVQRGSVMDMPALPRRPALAGVGVGGGEPPADAGGGDDADEIPVLPISYERRAAAAAQPGGPRGARGLARGAADHLPRGPGPARGAPGARLRLAEPAALRRDRARSRARVWPDQWVVYGNHHDAWVNGAEDPISGQVALEEAARALGALLKTGWRPARTIVFAAWDGEEWGLLGSTEWAEKHADELKEKGVVYFNSDTQHPRLAGRRGLALAAGVHPRGGARRPRPEAGQERADAAIDRRLGAAAEPARGGGIARHGRRGDRDTVFAVGALGLGLRLHRLHRPPRRASMNVSYGGDADAGDLPLHLRLVRLLPPLPRPRLPLRRGRGADDGDGGAAAGRRARAALRVHPARRTYRRYVEEIEKEAKKHRHRLAGPLGGARRGRPAGPRRGALRGGVRRRARASSAAGARRGSALEAVNRTLYRTERRLTVGGRAAAARLVPPPDLRPRLLHRLRGEDDARHPRGGGGRARRRVAQREAARVAAALERYAAQVEQAADQLERALR